MPPGATAADRRRYLFGKAPLLPRKWPVDALDILALVIPLAECGQPDDRSSVSATAENTEPSKKEPTYIEKMPGNLAAELDGTEWILVYLYGRSPLDGTNITMNLDDDSIGGSPDCNYYGGKALMNEGALETRGGLNSTKVGCPGDINQQKSLAFAL